MNDYVYIGDYGSTEEGHLSWPRHRVGSGVAVSKKASWISDL